MPKQELLEKLEGFKHGWYNKIEIIEIIKEYLNNIDEEGLK